MSPVGNRQWLDVEAVARHFPAILGIVRVINTETGTLES